MTDYELASADVARSTRLLRWILHRTRPAMGWLPLILILALLIVLERGVTATGWFGSSTWTISAALYLGFTVGWLTGRWRGFWLWTCVVGLATVSVILAVPDAWETRQAEIPWYVTLWESVRQLYIAAWSWLRIVTQGGSSTDTTALQLALGQLGWVVGAGAAWSVVRRTRMEVAITPLLGALALLAYFANLPLMYVPFALGVSVVLGAIWRLSALEYQWQQARIDYSREIRVDAVVTTVLLAVAVFVMALVLSPVRLNAPARWFAGLPPVARADAALERAFLGLSRRATGRGSDGLFDGPGGRGALPRSFLLGDAPTLYETVMFEAVTDRQVEANWFTVSYDVYTGRGWARSESTPESIDPGAVLQPLPAGPYATVQQQVDWQYDDRPSRYVLGAPLAFGDKTTAYWRSGRDLVRVTGDASRYRATSVVPIAAADDLRTVSTDTAPTALRARYTALPRDLAPEIAALAVETTAGAATDYDRAVALEQFLRQYPYSLDVAAPPGDLDPVAFFLFELQAGYCDYYASSMVVMARSLGLPARFVIGFRQGEIGPDGRQTVRQIDGHSWPEIYFPGFGWIPFEPTAAYPALERGGAGTTSSGDQQAPDILSVPETAAIAAGRPWWSRAASALIVATAIPLIILLLRQRRERDALTVGALYGELVQRAPGVGIRMGPHLTPDEFAANAHHDLQVWRDGRTGAIAAWLDTLIRDVAAGVVRASYERPPVAATTADDEVWRRRTRWWRVRLLWLRLLQRLSE